MNVLMGSSEYFQHYISFPCSSLPADEPDVISQLFLIKLKTYFWVSL